MVLPTTRRPPVPPPGSDAGLALSLQRPQPTARQRLADVDRFDHPDAHPIRPGWAGETFDLHYCFQTLFGLNLREGSLGTPIAA